jgi:hypothetical protein
MDKSINRLSSFASWKYMEGSLYGRLSGKLKGNLQGILQEATLPLLCGLIAAESKTQSLIPSHTTFRGRRSDTGHRFQLHHCISRCPYLTTKSHITITCRNPCVFVKTFATRTCRIAAYWCCESTRGLRRHSSLRYLFVTCISREMKPQ